jgi:hypothetical protein
MDYKHKIVEIMNVMDHSLDLYFVYGGFLEEISERNVQDIEAFLKERKSELIKLKELRKQDPSTIKDCNLKIKGIDNLLDPDYTAESVSAVKKKTNPILVVFILIIIGGFIFGMYRLVVEFFLLEKKDLRTPFGMADIANYVNDLGITNYKISEGCVPIDDDCLWMIDLENGDQIEVYDVTYDSEICNFMGINCTNALKNKLGDNYFYYTVTKSVKDNNLKLLDIKKRVLDDDNYLSSIVTINQISIYGYESLYNVLVQLKTLKDSIDTTKFNNKDIKVSIRYTDNDIADISLSEVSELNLLTDEIDYQNILDRYIVTMYEYNLTNEIKNITQDQINESIKRLHRTLQISRDEGQTYEEIPYIPLYNDNYLTLQMFIILLRDENINIKGTLGDFSLIGNNRIEYHFVYNKNDKTYDYYSGETKVTIKEFPKSLAEEILVVKLTQQ